MPFTMENWPLRDLRGWEGVSYQRVFELPARRRRFDSVTVLDPASNRLVDQLGAHRLVVADWRVGADDRGGLVIRAGRQRVRVGRHEVPLPAALCATAEVHDWYDEVTDRFRIEVLLSNRVLGTIIGYQGSFTCRLVPAR